MRHPALRHAALVLLALAAAVMLAACGGGDGGGEDLAEGLSPAELLERSAAAAEEVETFRIGLELTGTVDVAEGGDAPGAALLSGPLDISGEGPVQVPDRASIDARVGLSGPTLQGNVTRVGDEVFLGVLGQEFQVALPPETVRLFGFGDLYPTLVRWTTDPAEAGREEVDGTQTVKVTGAVDPAAALEDLGPLLRSGDGPVPVIRAQDVREALTEGTVEAWIGTEDLLPRRVHLVLRGDLSGLGVPVGALDVDLTAEMSAFGEPVDIQAPRDARPLDLDQLGGLTGG